MFAPRNLMFRESGDHPPGDPSSWNCPRDTGRLHVAPAFEVLSTITVHVCVLSTHDEPTAHPSTASLKATSETSMPGTLLAVGDGTGVGQGVRSASCTQLGRIVIGVGVVPGCTGSATRGLHAVAARTTKTRPSERGGTVN